jgi:hypothetical protein
MLREAFRILPHLSKVIKTLLDETLASMTVAAAAIGADVVAVADRVDSVLVLLLHREPSVLGEVVGVMVESLQVDIFAR